MAFVDFNFNVDVGKAKGIFKILGYVILAVCVVFNQEIRDDFFNLNFFSKSIERQKEVRKELNKLVKVYKCDYVAVNLFHNGQRSINKTHFSKLSREYEGKRQGLPSLTYKFKNFDLEPYLDAFLKLEEDSHFYIKDAEKLPDLYMRDQMKYTNVRSVLYVAIWEKRNFMVEEEIIGFLSYEFPFPTDFSTAEIEAMKSQADNKIKHLVKQ